jgi:hypothetical protein
MALIQRHAEIAQRPRHHALPADAGAGGAPAAVAGIAAALPRYHARPDGAHHRFHPRPPHHLSQPRPAAVLRAGAEPAQPAHAGRPEELGRIRHPQLPQPPRAAEDYFSLQSADSRAVLQRERHGTLLVDVERKLDLYLRGLWQDHDHLVPYSTAFDEIRKPIPYYDKLGIRLPDVYDDWISLPRTPACPRLRGGGARGRGSRILRHRPLPRRARPHGRPPPLVRRRRSPTTGARSSAWRWSSSRTAASRRC